MNTNVILRKQEIQHDSRFRKYHVDLKCTIVMGGDGTQDNNLPCRTKD